MKTESFQRSASVDPDLEVNYLCHANENSWNILTFLRRRHQGGEVVLAIRPGRPWPTQTRVWPTQTKWCPIHHSCWPIQNLLGPLTGLSKWKLLELPLGGSCWERPLFEKTFVRGAFVLGGMSYLLSIYSWCPPKFKWFTWPDHAPFMDSLSSAG